MCTRIEQPVTNNCIPHQACAESAFSRQHCRSSALMQWAPVINSLSAGSRRLCCCGWLLNTLLGCGDMIRMEDQNICSNMVLLSPSIKHAVFKHISMWESNLSLLVSVVVDLSAALIYNKWTHRTQITFKCAWESSEGNSVQHIVIEILVLVAVMILIVMKQGRI